jgi:capsular exopolysaccharide synthesis family protein
MALFRKPQPVGPLQVADANEARNIPITNEELAMASEPRGQIAEQFRTLRNSITALNPGGAPRSLVVTSALRGEGKTVSVLNLAVALAEMPGAHVLVIDADLHHPALEGYLNLPRRQGLSELLSGRLDLDHAIRATSMPGLAILGAGALPKNPSELLASDRMKAVLNSLKRRYNYVLIDTPEAMTISDASLLGAIADGILLVVRIGSTPRQYVEQVNSMLENLGGNVLGTCLTGVQQEYTARGYRSYTRR